MNMNSALETCNNCDVLEVDPNSLGGYCADCEAEARFATVEEL